MKKSFLIKITFLVCCLLCLTKINAQETIKVGVYQNFPLVHKDNFGAPSGIFVDLINEIAKKENWKVEYVFNSWNQSFENLKDAKLDIITGITYLPERVEYIDYSNEAVITVWGVVCTAQKAPIQNILDLKDKKIAVLKGGVNGINFSKLSEKFELNCKFIELDSYDDVMEYVKTNKCDAGVVHNIYTKSSLEKYNLIETSILFNPNKMLFAVPKGKNEELVKTIDKYLHTWKTDSNSRYYIILRKWYGDNVIEAFQFPKWAKWVVFLLIFGIVVTIIIASVLRKLVKRKTIELTEANIILQKEIEAKERTKKVLHESEEKFKVLYHESPDMFVSVSPIDASILQCNKTLLQKTGFSRKEVIGAPIFKMYHDDCLEEVKKTFQQFVETGEIFEKELLLKTKKGAKINVSLNVKSVRDKTGKILFSISSWRDITSWKKLNKEANKSYEIMLNTIENMSEGFVSLDTNWIYTYVNERAASMFGRKPEDLIGKHIWTEFPEGIGQPFYHTYYKAVETQELINFEDYYQPWNRWFENKVVPSTRGLSIFFNDITERKLSDDELSKHRLNLEELVKERTNEIELNENALLNLVDDLNMQSTALDNANKKLTNINAEMEAFTYSVSHDLKAPLRGIDGYSKLLIDLYKNDLNEEALGFLKNIRLGTLQMNLLIEDLLSYSRLERQEFHIGNVILQPLINELLILLSGVIKKSKAQIKMSFSEDFMLLADTNGLKLVLRNLIDNALKFSSKSKNPQIEIGSSENSTHWLIFVKDNGVGFDMKYHDRIFKIFQRLHLPEEYEGTGIGLAMVEKAMHRMNGRIWAESELNKGTCFYIEFKK